MQKMNSKKRVSISLLILVLVFIVFNPTNASADLLGCMSEDKNIFLTLACKVTTTLYDIRKIIYILAGFGLIAFTFAAIFNKISFKHLANIALSLFLLSMITPFIEYFTSSDGSQPLTYGYFLQPSFTEDDYSMTFEECEGDECPIPTVVAGGMGMDIGGGSAQGTVTGSVLPEGVGLQTSGNSAGLLTTTTETDSRTGWQKFKDTIKTVAEEGVKAYNTASTVISAAGNVYNAVDSTVKGVGNAQGVGGIITAGVGAFNNFNYATGAITSAAGTIGTNYTDKEGQPSLGEKTENFFAGANNAANEGREVTQDVGTINGVVEGVKNIPSDIEYIFR